MSKYKEPSIRNIFGVLSVTGYNSCTPHETRHDLIYTPMGPWVVLWNIKTKKIERYIVAHDQVVTCIRPIPHSEAFHSLQPDDSSSKIPRFLTASFGGQVSLWNQDWKRLCTVETTPSGEDRDASCVFFANVSPEPRFTRIALAAKRGVLYILTINVDKDKSGGGELLVDCIYDEDPQWKYYFAEWISPTELICTQKKKHIPKQQQQQQNNNNNNSSSNTDSSAAPPPPPAAAAEWRLIKLNVERFLQQQVSNNNNNNNDKSLALEVTCTNSRVRGSDCATAIATLSPNECDYVTCATTSPLSGLTAVAAHLGKVILFNSNLEPVMQLLGQSKSRIRSLAFDNASGRHLIFPDGYSSICVATLLSIDSGVASMPPQPQPLIATMDKSHDGTGGGGGGGIPVVEAKPQQPQPQQQQLVKLTKPMEHSGGGELKYIGWNNDNSCIWVCNEGGIWCITLSESCKASTTGLIHIKEQDTTAYSHCHHELTTCGIDFNNNGDAIAVGDFASNVFVWSLDHPKSHHGGGGRDDDNDSHHQSLDMAYVASTKAPASVRALHWKPDGGIYIGDLEGNVSVWSVPPQTTMTTTTTTSSGVAAPPPPPPRLLYRMSQDVTSIRFFGDIMCSCSASGEMCLYDTKHEKMLATWQAHDSGMEIWSCEWSPDGKHIFTASEDQTTAIWEINMLVNNPNNSNNNNNTTTTTTTAAKESKHDTATTTTTSASSKIPPPASFSTTTTNNTTVTHNEMEGDVAVGVLCFSNEYVSVRRIKTLYLHSMAVTCVDVKQTASLGTVLATCSDDRRIAVYKILPASSSVFGDPVSKITTLPPASSSSSSGTTISEDDDDDDNNNNSGTNKTIFVSHVEDASIEVVEHGIYSARQAGYYVTYLCLEDGGDRLAAVTADGFVYVWDLTTHSLLSKKKTHLASIEGVRLHKAKKLMATCGSDCLVQVHQM